MGEQRILVQYNMSSQCRQDVLTWQMLSLGGQVGPNSHDSMILVLSASSPGVVQTGVPSKSWYLGAIVECCDDLAWEGLALAVEPTRANLVLATNSAWRMSDPSGDRQSACSHFSG